MEEVGVISQAPAAVVALHPVRSQLLSELRQPLSAAALAQRAGLSRQKVNYHLRAMEAQGLVTLAGTKQWGGLTERELVATASSFVISPEVLGEASADPARSRDHLSAGYLLALAARAVREVGDLVRRASAAKQHLATLSVDTVIRFRSAEDRAAFTRELTEDVNRIVAKYHDGTAPKGRSHRLLVLAHPLPRPHAEPEEAEGE